MSFRKKHVVYIELSNEISFEICLFVNMWFILCTIFNNEYQNLFLNL